MVKKNRAEMIQELEKFFGKKVFLIVYNPYKGGINEKEEIYFGHHFIYEMLKKEGIKECVLILEGMGGNLKTAILCSGLLRQNLQRYAIFVPTIAASALCYFILESDELLVGNKSCITQIDAIFKHDGKDYRAIETLNHPDPVIKNLAHKAHNPLLEKIKELLKTPPHVFMKQVSRRSQKSVKDLGLFANMWMAIFADVGVMVIAVLNAIRALFVKRL